MNSFEFDFHLQKKEKKQSKIKKKHLTHNILRKKYDHTIKLQKIVTLCQNVHNEFQIRTRVRILCVLTKMRCRGM